MRKKIIFIAICISLVSILKSNELDEGYNTFIKNDLKQSREHFKAAIQVDSLKAEAYLMLSILATIDQDNEAAFNYFLEFYKYSSNPDPYVMALWNSECALSYKKVKSKTQLKWLDELLKQQALNSTIRAYANETLGRHYEAVNDLKKSKMYLTNIGSIMDWQIVGDFENISASGFDKNYQPVYHAEPGYIFKNKIGADVKWFNLYKQVPGNWIDFTNNFYCQNTLVFAQTFCNSPSDQLVYLRIGTSGSLKTWINDQLVFSEENERNNGLDTYVFPVNLVKGNNRILLQIGCSEIDRCNFMFRITDLEGKLNDNLTFSTQYQSYTKSNQKMAVVQTSIAEEYLTKAISIHPEKLINYFVLANAFLANDKTHQASEILLKAEKIAPDCSYLLNQMIELYNRNKNRTALSFTTERLKQIDPDNPVVLNILINEAFDKENYKEVAQLIEKKEKICGENSDVLYYKIKLALDEKKSDEYSRLINDAYEKYPDDYTFVYKKFDLEKNIKRNQSGAINVLKTYTKKFFDKDAIGTLADEYFASGQVKEGIGQVEKLIDFMPYYDNYYKFMGNFYTEIGNFSLAKQYFEECLKIAPYYGPYHGGYGKAYEESGDSATAIKEFKQNIVYKPDDYENIIKLRKLLGKPDVFEYFPSKDYYELFKNSPTSTDYPSDNIITLSKEHDVVLYDDGGCETKDGMMFKTLTSKGIDYIKEFKIPVNANEKLIIEKAEVLKKNGSRLQAETNENQIVFPSLEIDDAVLLIYKKQKYINGNLSKYYYEKMLFDSWYPSLNLEYNLLAEKKVKFNYKLINSSKQPNIVDKGDFTLYSWQKGNTKAFQYEAYMPSLFEVGEFLQVSNLPDWDFLSKWYYDISNTKIKPDKEIKDLVAYLLKGKENLSELKKARIFYKFIVNNIHYSSVSFRQSGIVPQKASDVLITRIGDCKDLSVLFSSMCQVVNIKAGIMLVNERDWGNNYMLIPSFDFDHAIAKANLDGKDYYIELTAPYFPFATLNENLMKANVLPVNNDTSLKTNPIIMNPSSRQPNSMYRESKIYFKDDKMFRDIYTIRTGTLAADMRITYRDIGKEEREKKFNQGIADDYPNTKLLNLTFDSSLYNSADTVSYRYSCSAPNVFTNITNLSILKLPITDPIKPYEFLSSDERKYPITMWKFSSIDSIEENLTIVIPEGKTIAEIPKSVYLECNQAKYLLEFNLKGHELKVHRKKVNKNDFVPVADYKEYKKFMEMLINSDNLQIGFK